MAQQCLSGEVMHFELKWPTIIIIILISLFFCNSSLDRKIQGLGLYAARDLEKHTMVIEYIGEVIRSELSELREKQYEAKVWTLFLSFFSFSTKYVVLYGFFCSSQL